MSAPVAIDPPDVPPALIASTSGSPVSPAPNNSPREFRSQHLFPTLAIPSDIRRASSFRSLNPRSKPTIIRQRTQSLPDLGRAQSPPSHISPLPSIINEEIESHRPPKERAIRNLPKISREPMTQIDQVSEFWDHYNS